jgi:5-methyltetrahydrofolate--homocysteine methyltransferase
VILIGEKINASRKSIRMAICDRDAGSIEQVIRAQDEAGADYIDLNAGTGSGDREQEAKDLAWLVDVALDCTEKKLALDSSDSAVLRRTADHLAGRRAWMLNSINGEQDHLDELLPAAVEHAVPVIALAMDERGIPGEPSVRVAICERIFEAATAAGVDPEQLFFDPLVLPVSTNVTYGSVMLTTLRTLKERLGQAKTTLGLSNVSHGLPRRPLINQAFLIAALSHGLDSAICDPTDPTIRQAVLLGNLVAGRDRYCRRFTRAVRQGTIECLTPPVN